MLCLTLKLNTGLLLKVDEDADEKEIIHLLKTEGLSVTIYEMKQSQIKVCINVPKEVSVERIKADKLNRNSSSE